MGFMVSILDTFVQTHTRHDCFDIPLNLILISTYIYIGTKSYKSLQQPAFSTFAKLWTLVLDAERSKGRNGWEVVVVQPFHMNPTKKKTKDSLEIDGRIWKYLEISGNIWKEENPPV